jgi:hypothetical protein
MLFKYFGYIILFNITFVNLHLKCSKGRHYFIYTAQMRNNGEHERVRSSRRHHAINLAETRIPAVSINLSDDIQSVYSFSRK